MKAKEMIFLIASSPEYTGLVDLASELKGQNDDIIKIHYNQLIDLIDKIRLKIHEYRNLFIDQITQSYRGKGDNRDIIYSTAGPAFHQSMDAFDRQVKEQLSVFHLLYESLNQSDKVKEVKA